MTPPPVVPEPHPIVRAMNSLAALVVGFAFLAFGFGTMAFTLRQPAHDDKILLGGAILAVLGALIVTPQAAGGAIKSLGLTITQFWPGGRRATDPPPEEPKKEG